MIKNGKSFLFGEYECSRVQLARKLRFDARQTIFPNSNWTYLTNPNTFKFVPRLVGVYLFSMNSELNPQNTFAIVILRFVKQRIKVLIAAKIFDSCM